MRKDQELGDRIKRIQAPHDGRYGILRMPGTLKVGGHERHPGHNQVARVMWKIGCQAVVRRAYTYRVYFKKGQLLEGTILENVLNRKFEQSKPRSAFVTDVTYIPVKEGWLYVSPVVDLCTREVVVCKMSTCQDLNLALKTLRKLNKIIDSPAMLHNDQGALYTSLAFGKEAQKYGIAQSYS